MASLHFDPRRHRFTANGLWVPHVTFVLGPLQDFSEIPPWNLAYARERGEAVHVATALHDQDDLDEETLDPVIVPYLEAYKRFRRETHFEPELIEARVHSERYGYAGILDRFGEGLFRGKRHEALIDIKVVAKVSPVTGLQTAAYREAHCSDRRRKPLRFGLQLREDGTYRLPEYQDFQGDLSVFLSALQVYRWKVKHNLEAPDGEPPPD